MYREDKIKYQLNKLNERFKELETFEELKEFKEEINSYHRRYRLEMKKSGHEAYGFTHLFDEDPHTDNPKYENKVGYLLSDGTSNRESFIKNLHRNIEVVY